MLCFPLEIGTDDEADSLIDCALLSIPLQSLTPQAIT